MTFWVRFPLSGLLSETPQVSCQAQGCRVLFSAVSPALLVACGGLVVTGHTEVPSVSWPGFPALCFPEGALRLGLGF